HRQALGHLGEVERADVVDDGLAVELRERQFDRVRARGDDDVGAGQLDLAAVVLPDLDQAVGVQGGEAVVGGDLVGLEQLRDAAGELLHDGVLAADHLPHVDLRVAGGDAVLAEDVLQVVELARGIEQRLGRDAAHAQAGAAECRLAVLAQGGVDAGGLHAQLGGTDRGVVAGRAGADDDDVELFGHFMPSQREWGIGNGESEGRECRDGVAVAIPDSLFPTPDGPAYRPRTMRPGFSSWFLMSTRNSTASLPSMMRWSEDRAMYIIGAATTWPFSTMARSLMACMPRI